jgi:hypothetical protein
MRHDLYDEHDEYDMISQPEGGWNCLDQLVADDRARDLDEADNSGTRDLYLRLRKANRKYEMPPTWDSLNLKQAARVKWAEREILRLQRQIAETEKMVAAGIHCGMEKI